MNSAKPSFGKSSVARFKMGCPKGSLKNGAHLSWRGVHALSIEIRLHEKHGPPHFHVTYQGEEASFSILDCRRLRGKMGLKRFDAKIRLMVEQESNALDQKMECLSSDRLSRWSNKFVAFLAVRQ
jgi:hypothetical protein